MEMARIVSNLVKKICIGSEMDIFIDSLFEKFYQQHPLVLVDIGAAGNISDRWQLANKHLEAFCFEPDERSFQKLTKTSCKNIRFSNIGILDKQNEITLYLTKRPQCSSVLLPNIEFLSEFPDVTRFDIVNHAKITTDTLDSQLKQMNCSDVDFIKIDSQGSELLVLRGAFNILKNAVFGVKVEVEFVPLYKNQPLFSDIDVFLRKIGFQLFDISQCYWKRAIGHRTYGKGQIIYADALYLKAYKHLETTMGQKGDGQKAKVLKAISICLLYGYYDYALAICEKACPKNIFTGSEKKTIFTNILNQTETFRGILNLRRKKVAAVLIHNIYKHIKQNQKKWLQRANKLGN